MSERNRIYNHIQFIERYLPFSLEAGASFASLYGSDAHTTSF